MFKVSRVTVFAYVSMILIVVGALLMPNLVTKYDAAAHIAVFSALMFWPALVMADVRKSIFAGLLMIAVSGIVEYLQHYSLERTPSWGDFGMNTVGVVIGLVAGVVARRFVRALNQA